MDICVCVCVFDKPLSVTIFIKFSTLLKDRPNKLECYIY